MKFYQVEVTDVKDNKHIEFTSAENDLEAIDKVYAKYKNIKDIRLI